MLTQKPTPIVDVETSPLESLCTIEEIAQAAYVTPQTVRNWMDRGIMPPAIRIGRRCLRWRSADIQKWFTENQSQSQPKPENSANDNH